MHDKDTANSRRQGRKDREARVTTRHGGSAGTSSQDILLLVSKLYEHSRQEATSLDGNWSRYVYAGLPMLLAALQALVAEFEFLLNPSGSGQPPDVNRPEFLTRYEIAGSLLERYTDLIELRNEVIHPAHAPTGNADNWPDYLRRVKEAGLLNTTGDPRGDYILLSQLASHRLFTWAVAVTRELYEKVIESDPARATQFRRFLSSFEPPWF
jgi:hypothetical protein